ncbi:MAG: site-2 protease family protein [Bacilli bacterium]|nr:site-2 protease family protein [Bacilli bacterium]
MFVLIVIHECGHLLCAKKMGISTKNIIIYPLGGICQLEMDINENPKVELLILLMGPIFQWIAYFLLVFLLKDKEFIKEIHYGILSFNLLPIYPLDGGRITNIIVNHFASYRKSFKISIIISYLCTAFILFSQTKISINIIILYSVLMFLIRKEEMKKDLYFHKFILERLLKKYKYKKTIIIDNIKEMYRYKNNIIKEGNTLISEKDYLFSKYEKISKNY